MGKLSPKLSTTAKTLYGLYFIFTVIEVILLCLGGMKFFDSLLISFGTAGTGGFGLLNSVSAATALIFS